jgi:hypothetical protein
MKYIPINETYWGFINRNEIYWGFIENHVSGDLFDKNVHIFVEIRSKKLTRLVYEY